MAILRRFFLLILLAILVVTTTLWGLSKIATPALIKDYVSQQLSTILSQTSHVNGDISWEMLPRPRIKLTNIQIGNCLPHEAYCLTLNNLFLNLKITPLLRGKLIFNEIKGEGFHFQINTIAKPSTPAKMLLIPRTLNSGNYRFAIERFLLSHGKITFVNKETTLVLKNLQIGAEQINLQQTSFPLQFKSNLDYTHQQSLLAKGYVQFKGSASLSTLLFTDPSLGLKSSSLNGQLIIHNAQVERFKINKLQANTMFKNNILNLNPLTISLYQGESIGNLKYNLLEKKLQLTQTATNLDSAALSWDLIGKKLLQGKLDLSLHSQTDFQHNNHLDSITGNGNITVREGVLEPVNLHNAVNITGKNIDNLLTHKPKEPVLLEKIDLSSADFYLGNTPFKLLTLQYHFDKALFNADALFLQTDFLRLKGNGQINLNDYQLNTHFLAELPSAQQKIDQIQRSLGGGFPFLITGTLTNFKIAPDLKKLGPILLKKLVLN